MHVRVLRRAAWVWMNAQPRRSFVECASARWGSTGRSDQSAVRMTVPVNPDGETELTRARAWRGLVLEARDARRFLPPHLRTRCEVVEGATQFVREGTIGAWTCGRSSRSSPGPK